MSEGVNWLIRGPKGLYFFSLTSLEPCDSPKGEFLSWPLEAELRATDPNLQLHFKNYNN